MPAARETSTPTPRRCLAAKPFKKTPKHSGSYGLPDMTDSEPETPDSKEVDEAEDDWLPPVSQIKFTGNVGGFSGMGKSLVKKAPVENDDDLYSLPPSRSRNSRTSTYIAPRSNHSARSSVRHTPYKNAGTTSRALQRAREKNAKIKEAEAKENENLSRLQSQARVVRIKEDIDSDPPFDPSLFGSPPPDKRESLGTYPKTPVPSRKRRAVDVEDVEARASIAPVSKWSDWLSLISPKSLVKAVTPKRFKGNDGRARKSPVQDVDDDTPSLPGSFEKPAPKRVPSESPPVTESPRRSSTQHSSPPGSSPPVSPQRGPLFRYTQSPTAFFERSSSPPVGPPSKSVALIPQRARSTSLVVARAAPLRQESAFVQRMKSTSARSRYNPYARPSVRGRTPTRRTDSPEVERGARGNAKSEEEEQLEEYERRRRERMAIEAEEGYSERQLRKKLGLPIEPMYIAPKPTAVEHDVQTDVMEPLFEPASLSPEPQADSSVQASLGWFDSDKENENISAGPPPTPSMSHRELPGPIASVTPPPPAPAGLGLFSGTTIQQPPGGFGLALPQPVPQQSAPSAAVSRVVPSIAAPLLGQRNQSDRFKPNRPSRLRDSTTFQDENAAPTDKENEPTQRRPSGSSSSGLKGKSALGQSSTTPAKSSSFGGAVLGEKQSNEMAAGIKVDVKAKIAELPAADLGVWVKWPGCSEVQSGNGEVRAVLTTKWEAEVQDGVFKDLFAPASKLVTSS